jgi:predicted methyltransferase
VESTPELKEMLMTRLALLCASALLVSACAPRAMQEADMPRADAVAGDAVLRAAVAGDWRSAEPRARDAYRWPADTLAFWGLKPGMTVVEIDPGAEAWWTEILAPYAARTGGRFVAGYADLGAPTVSDAAKKARTDFETRFGADPRYGQVRAVNFGMTSGLGMEAGSADMILVARAFHNWSRAGRTDRYMSEFFRVLKPGGILAVEQHRAPDGSDWQKTAPTGYVPESYVIDAAQKAGFQLEARSELNANARDTRDHPFGVWTLPPIRRTEQAGRTLTAEERARYDAIGESDRMTLRFRKPG